MLRVGYQAACTLAWSVNKQGSGLVDCHLTSAGEDMWQQRTALPGACDRHTADTPTIAARCASGASADPTSSSPVPARRSSRNAWHVGRCQGVLLQRAMWLKGVPSIEMRESSKEGETQLV